MSRTGRRISRSLIGILIITLVLGLAFYLKNTSTTRAADEPRPALQAPRPVAVVTSPVSIPAPAPITAAPTTAPVQAAVAEAPTTKPAIAMVTDTTSQPPAPAGAPEPPRNPLAQAAARKDAGDLLGARIILNDALLAGTLSTADAESAKQAISEINQTVVFSPKRFADDPYGGTYSVQPGDLMTKIAAKCEIPWESLLRLNGMTDPKKLRAGQTIKIIHGPFNVVVTKSKFTMDLYLGPPLEKGSMYITTYAVGLGKDDSTPTGTWLCEAGKKIKNPTYYSPRGEGVIDSDDPKNPLGHRWIGLSGIDGHAVGQSSYGIHGTIDESSVGKQESMGCIRMHNADVELVFDLLLEGKSLVIVKD
jgi:LysM repeat protein